jgi:histidinol-phosphate aminotransferase
VGNRYPDGGCWRLTHALAERHDVGPEEITVAAGADAVIGYLAYATLDPGDEVVTAWPSFPSYVLDPLKLGAVPVRVPLRDLRLDLDALLAAITPRTKLVFLATPNNPTGTTTTRAEIDAYFEYIDDPDYPDGVEEYARRGRRVVVLRTFSKIYGLAGFRVGYGVGPAALVSAIRKVQRAFDVGSASQAAALASLGDDAELARRRAVNRRSIAELERILREHGYDPVGPAAGNFLFVEIGEDAEALNAALLRQGVIVRPMGAFGAPTALRVTAGTPDEIAFFAEALAAVRAGATG